MGVVLRSSLRVSALSSMHEHVTVEREVWQLVLETVEMTLTIDASPNTCVGNNIAIATQLKEYLRGASPAS